MIIPVYRVAAGTLAKVRKCGAKKWSDHATSSDNEFLELAWENAAGLCFRRSGYEMLVTHRSVTVGESDQSSSEFLFSDGGVVGQNPSPHGYTWAWCLVKGVCRVAHDSGLVRPESGSVTNNLAELEAAVRGLESLPEGWAGFLVIDSACTIARLIRGSHDPSMDGVPISLQVRAAIQRQKKSYTVVRVKGHPTRADLARGRHASGACVSEHNEFVDSLCNAAKWRMER